jgi:hypothetical protein
MRETVGAIHSGKTRQNKFPCPSLQIEAKFKHRQKRTAEYHVIGLARSTKGRHLEIRLKIWKAINPDSGLVNCGFC